MKFTLKWILFLHLLPFYWAVQGQNLYEIQWSKVQESKKDFVSGRIIHADSNGVLLIRQEIEEYYEIGSTISGSLGKKLPPVIEHFTPELRRDYAFDLKGWSALQEDHLIQAGEVEGHFDRWYYPYWTNNKPWFTYSQYNKKDKNITFFAKEVDLDQQKLTGLPIELFQLKDSVEVRSGPESMKDYLRLSSIGDQAQSKLMFFTFPQYGYPNRFNVKIFDRKMKFLWAKEYNLPFIPNTFEIRDICLSTTGKFYCLARVYEVLPENGKSPVNITFMSKFDYASFTTILLEFSSNSEKANMYRLDMGEKILVDAGLKEDKDGQIHCVGGYTLDKYNRFYGFVDFVLNPFEQTISLRGPIPFSQPLLQKISLEKNTAKHAFVEAYDVNSPYFSPDGTIKVFGGYSDYKGAYHVVKLIIDAQFQEIKGIRIKKSQLVQRQSDWLFAGSVRAVDMIDKADILVFNDDIQGDNQINLFESKAGEGTTYQFPQPDPENRLLFVSESLGRTSGGRVYLIAETRGHKKYRLGYIQRKQ